MNNETAAEPLHDNLRDLIGQAISDEIAAGAAQPDWCDSREIDRLADAVMGVLPKRRTTLSPALRAALDEAAKTGATVAEIPGGGLVFINRGEQLEDSPDLNCPACGGSGHADDAHPMPAFADDAFAAFCDRKGYPSDGEIDVALREAFDEALRFAACQPPADAAPVDAKPESLFDRKLADLQQRGYEVIGRILHKDGQYALFDSSCRWLTKAQCQRLMHEQDGSLFSAQPSTTQGNSLRQQSAPTASQERAWYKVWLAGISDSITVDQIEFGRRAWAERARRAAGGGAG